MNILVSDKDADNIFKEEIYNALDDPMRKVDNFIHNIVHRNDEWLKYLNFTIYVYNFIN